MKEPYEEGVAIHLDLQSCASNREAAGEALAEAHAGWVLSSESPKRTRCRRFSCIREARSTMAINASHKSNRAESETPCA